MTDRPTQALEAVRSLTAARATGQPLGDLAVLTRAMLEAVEIASSQALLPLWAACRLAEDDPLVLRALSFVIARHTPDFAADRWLPMLWLLVPPHPLDHSTIQNCLTALQRHPDLSGITLRVLRREIGTFLVHALDQADDLMEAVIDVLYSYLDADVLQQVLTTREERMLRDRLRSASSDLADPVVKMAQTLATEIEAQTFQDEFPDVLEDLRSFLDARSLPSTTDEWVQVLRWTEESVREFVERYAAFEDLTAVATARNTPMHELRVAGRWATVGKLPIDFLERILRTWKRFYTEVRRTVADGSDSPNLFVLAPTRGSFVVRVLVDANIPALEVDAKAAEEIVALAVSATEATSSLVYSPLLELAEEYSVDLEIGIAVPGPARTRQRIRIAHISARQKMLALTTRESQPAARVEIIGVLDGANRRTGKFELLPLDGREAIAGTVVRGGNKILLDKTIGDTYRFDLSRTTDPSTRSERWELVRLSAVQTQQVVAASATRELLAPRPTILTSNLVPQSDSLKRIIQIVELVASGSIVSPETIDLSQRHIDYAKQAARLLHLLSDEGALLPAGATLITLSNARRFDYLAIQFEVSIFGRAWLEWAGVTRVADLDPKTAHDFLRQRSNLSESMIQRRGRTLRRWARDLGRAGG